MLQRGGGVLASPRVAAAEHGWGISYALLQFSQAMYFAWSSVEKAVRILSLKCSTLPNPLSITPNSCCRSRSWKHLALPASHRSKRLSAAPKTAFCVRASSSSGVQLGGSGSSTSRSSTPASCQKQYTSMRHQSRSRYVGPAQIIISRQPATKMGRQPSCSSMALCVMQALSSHTRGSRPSRSSNSLAHRERLLHLCSGESDHECEMKASQAPSSTGTVCSCRPVSALVCRSSRRSLEKGSARNRAFPS
mmetsp:Transcript_37070/g.122860  ORF Transcript_37070/g.122860 Transcript_37070/m.122860 type:complete len:249 (-) Transcript_37070:953-1699(-)